MMTLYGTDPVRHVAINFAKGGAAKNIFSEKIKNAIGMFNKIVNFITK